MKSTLLVLTEAMESHGRSTVRVPQRVEGGTLRFMPEPPPAGGLFPTRSEKAPRHYLLAHSDGGARGNPGPAGYGVVIQDASGKKIATLSRYLGHQTNNFAEYQGLIAALEYAVDHGHKALKLVSDSELLVRQMKGIYKVKNSALQDLHARAKELIAKLDWFQIEHALREHNHEADRLANEAMDHGADRTISPPSASASSPEEFEGIVQGGMVKLPTHDLPEGTRVQVRVKK
jgi:ribonuclease HI